MTNEPTDQAALAERIAALDARLVRVESVQAIERLAHLYTLYADARDLDQLLLLFVADVDCGRLGIGRDALRASYEVVHRRFYRTVHHVVGHTIEFHDADRASGKVMMRAEHEVGERWIVAMLCMFDDYERHDGSWYFVRRKPEAWYSTDFAAAPTGPTFTAADWDGRPPRLPHRFPSWARFWEGHADEVARLTQHP
jgi:hypothetical protein